MLYILGFLSIIIFFYMAFRDYSANNSRPIQYGTPSFTENGEQVKSWGEKQIADYFERNEINYEYEPGLRGIYANPDFYLSARARELRFVRTCA